LLFGFFLIRLSLWKKVSLGAILKKTILLIVTGGIAAYKSLELIRLLKDDGFTVLPVMTRSAKKFVTPLSLSVLSGEKVVSQLHDVDSEMSYGHIELSRKADLVVVAPATANIIAKLANGIADDLATSILLATDKPVVVAPAMNFRMWEHSATKRNISQIVNDGVRLVGPEEGLMACGEFGYGRMAEPLKTFEIIKKELTPPKLSSLTGKRILITSGPTEEPIDPVRYISNRSSGIQGHAIADTLISYGAEVIFITGPVDKPMPRGAKVFKVTTADEMFACVNLQGYCDIAICVAAVSDWRASTVKKTKLKKEGSEGSLTLELVKNPDILAHLASLSQRPRLIVGFAAETDNLNCNASQKLKSKNCDWILANDVSLERGVMGLMETEIKLFSKNETKVFPKMSKIDFAKVLADRICLEFE
jgi:phosphopantothenoylcysteine decarboxylase/phosphopantothenate--cysteine ligase